MKKLSITFASAALVSASLPWIGGCSPSSPAEQTPALKPPLAEQPTTAPLKLVAVPPSLQTISFETTGDLFAPPPAPRCSGDATMPQQPRHGAVDRGRSGSADATELGEWSPGTDVVALSERTPPPVPPMSFPEYDASTLQGADFDYHVALGPSASEAQPIAPTAPPDPPSVAEPLPPVEAPAVDVAEESRELAIIPPANHRGDQAAGEPARHSQWRPPSEENLGAALPLPPADEAGRTESESVPPAYAQAAVDQPAPAPMLPPSQRAQPALVDTSEWSAAEAVEPATALPYPSTGQAAITIEAYAAPYPGPIDAPETIVAPPATTVPPVAVEPLEFPLSPGVNMQVVRHHARMLIARGTELGERGALYSAKADFVHAMRLVAESQDAASGDRRHSEALHRAWRALDEAEDFSPGGAHSVDMKQVVAAHRTPLLHDADLSQLTPLGATQKYFAYAQEQLALAGGGEPVAADALYRLGKTHAFIARESNEAARTNGPRALAMQQAALMVDQRHDGAANELGVLLAKYGQWNDARRVLLHAVSLRPTAEKWRNLAVVHEHLGEASLAELARQEADLAAVASGGQHSAGNGRVQWVSPERFVQGTAAAAGNLQAAEPIKPPEPAKETDTAWKWPWFK